VLRRRSLRIREAPFALLLTPGDMLVARHRYVGCPTYRVPWATRKVEEGRGKPRHCESRDSGFASTNRLRGRRPPGDGVLRHTPGASAPPEPPKARVSTSVGWLTDTVRAEVNDRLAPLPRSYVVLAHPTGRAVNAWSAPEPSSQDRGAVLSPCRIEQRLFPDADVTLLAFSRSAFASTPDPAPGRGEPSSGGRAKWANGEGLSPISRAPEPEGCFDPPSATAYVRPRYLTVSAACRCSGGGTRTHKRSSRLASGSRTSRPGSGSATYTDGRRRSSAPPPSE
jgi:hypothetical protein